MGPATEDATRTATRAIVAIVYEAEIVSGTPQPGDDETQEIGWFAPDDLEGLGLSAPSRAQLAALGLTV